MGIAEEFWIADVELDDLLHSSSNTTGHLKKYESCYPA
ncbi:hypothetical protein BH11PLA2_BH11PLA2_11190 [soil metagenome]